MISSNLDYFKFKGGMDVIATSINLFKYRYTDSLFHTENTYNRELLIDSNFDYKFSPVDNDDQEYKVEYRFNYGTQNDLIEETIRERESFISVVSKIGGLLAFFKISALLFLMHNYLYERTTVRQIIQQQQRMHSVEVSFTQPSRLNQTTELIPLIEKD